MSETIVYEEKCKECKEKNEVIIEPVDISTRKKIKSQSYHGNNFNYTIQYSWNKERLCHMERTSAESSLSKINGATFLRLRFY